MTVIIIMSVLTIKLANLEYCRNPFSSIFATNELMLPSKPVGTYHNLLCYNLLVLKLQITE